MVKSSSSFYFSTLTGKKARNQKYHNEKKKIIWIILKPDWNYKNVFISGTGVIDFVEFLEMWAKYSGDLDGTIKEAFNLFDRDGSGTISMEEFRRVMVNEGNFKDNIWIYSYLNMMIVNRWINSCVISLGAQMTDEEIDEIISEVDVDGDGQMNINGKSIQPNITSLKIVEFQSIVLGCSWSFIRSISKDRY